MHVHVIVLDPTTKNGCDQIINNTRFSCANPVAIFKKNNKNKPILKQKKVRYAHFFLIYVKTIGTSLFFRIQEVTEWLGNFPKVLPRTVQYQPRIIMAAKYLRWISDSAIACI